MSKWTDKDTQGYQDQKDGSHDSSREIARAEHDARNDAQRSGELQEREASKSDGIFEGISNLMRDIFK